MDEDLLRLAAIAGTVGGFLSVGAFLPQAYRIIQRRSAADVSLAMYLIALASCGLWMFYAWVHGSMELLVTNAVIAVIALAIVVLKVRFDRGK